MDWIIIASLIWGGLIGFVLGYWGATIDQERRRRIEEMRWNNYFLKSREMLGYKPMPKNAGERPKPTPPSPPKKGLSDA